MTDTKTTYPSQIKASSRELIVARDFSGIMVGLKYFKTSSPPNTNIYSFNYGFENTASLLVFFYLRPQGMISQTQEFQNFALTTISFDSQSLRRESGTISFGKFYFQNTTTVSTVGTINQALNYDGYTCKDNGEKLLFTSEQSYAEVAFTPSDQI